MWKEVRIVDIYTKKGDSGWTSLLNGTRVPKYDERIELNGIIDELNSHLGLVKAAVSEEAFREEICTIQRNLMKIMSGVAASCRGGSAYRVSSGAGMFGNQTGSDAGTMSSQAFAGRGKDQAVSRGFSGGSQPLSSPDRYAFCASDTAFLETRINELEASFPRQKDFVLYGGCELSARLDVARAVARRAERRFARVTQLYGTDAEAGRYLNRLSDYLYVRARYEDYRAGY